MRVKFTLMVAAMALGIAALAPAANAETVRLLNQNKEVLPDESVVNGFSEDFAGKVPGNGEFHCDEAEWYAVVTNVEDNVELNLIPGTPELRGCHYTKYNPEGEVYAEYPWSFSNLEMEPVLLEPDGLTENLLLSYSNNNWNCVFMGGAAALSFTPSSPALLHVEAHPHCEPYLSIQQDLAFNMELWGPEGELSISVF